MNLKVEINGIKLEIQNGDLRQVEKTLLGLFTQLEGGSFVEGYHNTSSEERPVKSFRNHVPTENGIKIINGTTLYQCSYSCGCGNVGKRFVKEDANNTSCHKCNTTLIVQPATEYEAHDKDFNYFIAY